MSMRRRVSRRRHKLVCHAIPSHFARPYLALADGSMNSHPIGVSLSTHARPYALGKNTNAGGGIDNFRIRLKGKYGIIGLGSGLSEILLMMTSITRGSEGISVKREMILGL